MDAVIVSLLVVAVICYACYKRKFSVAVYGIATIDLFLRISNFIIWHYFKGSQSEFFAKMPSSIYALIDKYLDGFFFEVLVFLYIALAACFLFYTAKAFFKSK